MEICLEIAELLLWALGFTTLVGAIIRALTEPDMLFCRICNTPIMSNHDSGICVECGGWSVRVRKEDRQ